MTVDDIQLKNFFKIWTPWKLDSLIINWFSLKIGLIKATFYMDEILKPIKSALKEIYIQSFSFSSKESQQVIKSAFNCEKLNFCWCEIQCSKALDFITIDPYKIKCLGFQNWGNPKIENNKTDWIKNPSSFENIIDAISKCTLKYILEKLNIFSKSNTRKW